MVEEVQRHVTKRFGLVRDFCQHDMSVVLDLFHIWGVHDPRAFYRLICTGAYLDHPGDLSAAVDGRPRSKPRKQRK
jgi:hypothetical protein